MRAIWNKSKYLLMLLITLVSFSSCFFDNNDEDDQAEWSMVGQWYVSRVSGGNSPYREYDTFVFQQDRTFYSYDSYTKEPLGSGTWRIQNRSLIISFNGWDADIIANMSNFPDNDVLLNVNDRDYGNYTLELRRDY